VAVVVNFAIDSVRLSHQPYALDLEADEPRLTRSARGYVIPSAGRGRTVRVTWGERALAEAAVAELRALLGTTLAHVFSWGEPDGSQQSIPVVLDSYETAWLWSEPGFYQTVELVARERAPDRAAVLRQVFLCGRTSTTTALTQFNSVDLAVYGWQPTVTNKQSLFPSAGVLSKLRVRRHPSWVLPVGESCVYTVVKNGVDTALTVTINGPDTYGENLSATVSVVAGDLLALKGVRSAGTVSGMGFLATSWSLEFDPAVSNQAVVASAATNPAAYPFGAYDPVLTTYQHLGELAESWTTTLSDAESLWAATGTIRSLYLWLTNAPGAGRSVALTIVRNGVAEPSSTVTIAGTAVTGSVTGLAIPVAPGDRFALRAVPTGSPTRSYVASGVAYDCPDAHWNISGSAVNPASTPLYDRYHGGFDWTGFEPDVEIDALAPFTVDRLRVHADTAPGGAQDFVLRRNAADTPAAVALPAGQTVAAGTGAQAYAAGDRITIKTAGPGGLGVVRWAMRASN
jgi:hypothetical protein